MASFNYWFVWFEVQLLTESALLLSRLAVLTKKSYLFETKNVNGYFEMLLKSLSNSFWAFQNGEIIESTQNRQKNRERKEQRKREKGTRKSLAAVFCLFFSQEVGQNATSEEKRDRRREQQQSEGKFVVTERAPPLLSRLQNTPDFENG